uniref:Vacuolar ATP synthase subunit E n=1 Tax=Vannella robusta TaxID=1487602 RepID=A0A7S4MM06_9EUKA
MAKTGDEVERQLKNMISFILAEAEEKAKEINFRAEEEFNIEKTRIVQEEKKRINEDFAQRMKSVEVQKKIAHSNQLNQCRLSSLKARETAIHNILAETQQKLVSLTQNEGQYKELLESLILQALLKMKEQEISIICREQDTALIESVVSNVVGKFKEKTNITAKITVEKKHRLAPGPKEGYKGPTCAGGVVLSALGGKILCNNTFEQRLALASEGLLPEIRAILFGATARK